MLTLVFTEHVSVRIELDLKLSFIEFNTDSKLLIGVAIKIKSAFLTASLGLENISSESFCFSITSLTDLSLSYVITFFYFFYFLSRLKTDEPIKPQPIIVT